MSGPKDYEDAARRNSVDAVSRAMRSLKEHWSTVEITCTRTDAEGNAVTHNVDFTEDDDDDDDDVIPKSSAS